MLAIVCSSVPTASHRTLVSESRILSLTDDGAGRITLRVACHAGHVHEVVTGRGAAAEAVPQPVAVAC